MDKEYENNDMWHYLCEHNYISVNNNDIKQKELSVLRAECIANKYRTLTEEKDKEIEKLKNGYCELKVKCNNGECDCTNEEYDGMVEGNIKLSLENDELRNILEKMGTNPNEILYLKNEVDRLNDGIDETIKDIEHSTLLLEEGQVKLKDTPFGKRILYKLKELQGSDKDE